jgi:lipopolysaccharide exporter
MKRNQPPTLATRVRSGAVWNLATTIILRLSNILLTAVIAHILAPRDFGAYAVSLTAFAIVSAVGEFGVASCLIRADFDIDALAPTMVTVSLATSAVLAAAMAVAAEPIASMLGSAYAAGPVRVMSLAVILTGVMAVPSAQLIRDFRQDKLFLANVAAFVPSTLLLIVLAKSGGGAMAFAWSRVAGQFVVGLVFIIAVKKNYFAGLNRMALNVLFRFGVPLASANFVNFILINVDYALVGRFMGAVALGTYVLAFNVSAWPSSLLSAMINNVAMPAFSRVKQDAVLLRDAVVDGVRMIAFVVLPMCGIIMALARPLVATLYGPKWAASANVLSFLTIYAACSLICVLVANIISSMGYPKLLLVIQLIWLAALTPAMLLGVHDDGIVGAAFAHIAVIGPIVLPCYLLVLRRATGVGFRPVARAIFPALIAAVGAGLAAKAVSSQFTSPLVQLLAGSLVGGLVYVLIAAPQLLTRLNRAQLRRLRKNRVFRIYVTTARAVGLSVPGGPRHAAPRVRVRRAGPISQLAER